MRFPKYFDDPLRDFGQDARSPCLLRFQMTDAQLGGAAVSAAAVGQDGNRGPIFYPAFPEVIMKRLRSYLGQPRMLAAVAVLTAVLADRLSAWIAGVESPLLGAGTNIADALNVGLLAAFAMGHCDGMDGPVVTLAQKALDPPPLTAIPEGSARWKWSRGAVAMNQTPVLA